MATLEERLGKLGKRLDELQERVRKVKGKAREEAEERIRLLREEKDAFSRKVSGWRERAGAAAHELGPEMERAWDHLRGGVEKAWDRWKSKEGSES